jgi:hypothetical protein
MVMQSKGLIEIQRKLSDQLFELEVAHTSGLQRSPLILSNAKKPRKIVKKLPLQDGELERFERILTGKEELKKLDDRFTDYLIYLEQIKKRCLELHHQNDYTKFKYIGPDGIVHKKPSTNPKLATQYYEKVTKQHVGAPRAKNLKNRNNLKRVKHVELMGKYTMQEKNQKGAQQKVK